MGGAILTWTRAIGEFGATILLATYLTGVTQTIPMAIELGFERKVGVAIALWVTLVAVSTDLLLLTHAGLRNAGNTPPSPIRSE